MPVPSIALTPRLRRVAGHLWPSRRAVALLVLAHGVGLALRLSLVGHVALTVALEGLVALVGDGPGGGTPPGDSPRSSGGGGPTV